MIRNSNYEIRTTGLKGTILFPGLLQIYAQYSFLKTALDCRHIYNPPVDSPTKLVSGDPLVYWWTQPKGIALPTLGWIRRLVRQALHRPHRSLAVRLKHEKIYSPPFQTDIHLLINMHYTSPKVKRQCTRVYICIYVLIYITILSESYYNTRGCLQTHLLHRWWIIRTERKEFHRQRKSQVWKVYESSKVWPHHILCSPASKIGGLLNLYFGLVMDYCSKLSTKEISMT